MIPTKLLNRCYLFCITHPTSNYLAGCVIQKDINVNTPGGGGKGGGWPFDILEVADRSEDEVQDPEKKTNAILLKEPMKFEI